MFVTDQDLALLPWIASLEEVMTEFSRGKRKLVAVGLRD
jgi:hypothetical protein